MNLHESTIHQLRRLLERAESEPHTITLLTDEELAAVEPDPASTPYPTPWIEGSPGINRELAGRFGVRSLLARGLLRETVAAPGLPAVLDVPPEVRVVLDTRRTGLGYVRAMRPQGDAASSKIIVVQPELGTFEEDISVQGFHLFTACNYDDSTSRMARWCLPELGGRAGGGVAHITEPQWPEFLHDELPDAKVTDLSIEVFLSDRAGQREADRWLLAYSDTVALLARPTDQGLAVRPVTAQRLRDLLDDRIARALQFARSNGGIR